MSDQGYTSQDDQQEEDGGIFCKNCSPMTRKIGYYIQFLAGIGLFAFGIIFLLTLSVTFLIVGSLLAILSPLWIKSPKRCFLDLKDPGRLISTIIFLGLLAGTIVVSQIFDSSIPKFILGACLAVAGLWYFLSFFKNGQTALVTCIKTCCGKNENAEGGTAESV